MKNWRIRTGLTLDEQIEIFDSLDRDIDFESIQELTNLYPNLANEIWTRCLKEEEQREKQAKLKKEKDMRRWKLNQIESSIVEEKVKHLKLNNWQSYIAEKIIKNNEYGK